jgi:DNA-binding YbaB/EbfC family protein
VSFDDDSEAGGGFGLGDLLSQVQQMQEMIASAQAEASDQVVTGEAGDGAVKVSVSGGLEFQTVTISQAVVEQGDASLVEDLVLVALRDAMAKVGELNLSAMAHSGLDDLAGIDLGLGGGYGMSGLPGAGEEDDDDEEVEDAGGEPAQIRPIEMGTRASGATEAEQTDSGAKGDSSGPAD